MYHTLIDKLMLIIKISYLPGTEVALGIRLVDGSNRRMGRVEVNYNGNWSTVCAKRWNDWDVKEATVACNQLGFRR